MVDVAGVEVQHTCDFISVVTEFMVDVAEVEASIHVFLYHTLLPFDIIHDVAPLKAHPLLATTAPPPRDVMLNAARVTRKPQGAITLRVRVSSEAAGYNNP
jgi:hypothetical protein